MKKKILLICICLLIGIVLFISFHKKKQEDKYKDANVVCTYTYKNENETDSKNVLYIYHDKDEVITKLVYITIQDKDYFYDETINLTRTYVDIYDDVKGITGSVGETKDKIVTTIEYDYKTLDVEALKKIELLDEESIYFNLEFPFTSDEFMIYEVPDYDCKLK
jgi:hypothetical protein